MRHFLIMDAKNKPHLDESGQAIFEFIVFVPLFILLFTVVFSVGNSINASINQQKAVRGYYFTIVSGDSYFPNQTNLDRLRSESLSNVGFYSLGWRFKTENGGENSYGSCFKVNRYLGANESDTCLEPDIDEGSTEFVRVFTFFGVCGPSLVLDPESNEFETPWMQDGSGACAVF